MDGQGPCGPTYEHDLVHVPNTAPGLAEDVADVHEAAGEQVVVELVELGAAHRGGVLVF